MITLFPDEKIISESDGQRVVLTTHRICYEYKEWGRSYNQSIMLEHITSCENRSVNHYWLLIIVALVAGLSFLNSSNLGEPEILLIIVLASLLSLIYWFTKKNLITIGSPSTKMRINVAGMDRENVLNFINKIEQAKHQRINKIG